MTAVHSGGPARPARRWWQRPGKIALALAVAASFGIWVYAFSPFPSRRAVDTLEDTAFPTAAEPRCAEARARLEALPSGIEAETAEARAASLDASTDVLDAMVSELRALAPPEDHPDAATIDAWLDDWERYLADRRDYAERLREDGSARFQLSDRNGQAVTVAMDNLANVNDMPSCATPGDVG